MPTPGAAIPIGQATHRPGPAVRPATQTARTLAPVRNHDRRRMSMETNLWAGRCHPARYRPTSSTDSRSTDSRQQSWPSSVMRADGSMHGRPVARLFAGVPGCPRRSPAQAPVVPNTPSAARFQMSKPSSIRKPIRNPTPARARRTNPKNLAPPMQPAKGSLRPHGCRRWRHLCAR